MASRARMQWTSRRMLRPPSGSSRRWSSARRRPPPTTPRERGTSLRARFTARAPRAGRRAQAQTLQHQAPPQVCAGSCAHASPRTTHVPRNGTLTRDHACRRRARQAVRGAGLGGAGRIVWGAAGEPRGPQSVSHVGTPPQGGGTASAAAAWPQREPPLEPPLLLWLHGRGVGHLACHLTTPAGCSSGQRRRPAGNLTTLRKTIAS